jgi:hypothetical protein
MPEFDAYAPREIVRLLKIAGNLVGGSVPVRWCTT